MITKAVNLWLGSGPRVVIPVSQFDTAWEFVFTIINAGTEWTIPAGSSVVMNGLKPDGNVFAFSGIIVSNKVVVDADVQMTACAGDTICELSILADGLTVGTANFVLAVEAAPKSPSDISSNSTLPAYAEMLEMFSGDITDAVDDWLDDHSGEIGGLTNEAKQALLMLLGHVYFDDEHGPEYIEELRSALYPPISISAVFTQGSAVIYNTDTLDTLRQYLTVTANYSGGVTEVVTAYVLSGTLTVGTSTIMVTYGGKTDTFNVTVSKMPNGLVNGTYSASKGGTATCTVSDNTLSFGTVTGYAQFVDGIPFLNPISLHAGDVVKFTPTGDGGATTNTAIGIGFNGSGFSDGGGFAPWRATPLAKTVTLSEDIIAETLYIMTSTGSNRSFTLSITVNGEEVFS